MIKKVSQTERDRVVGENLRVNPQDIQDDHYDYSKVVVKKPWGYEYLIFENESVAVWVLYLKNGALTSMHCHPGKKTSLIVLQGKVVCSSLTNNFERCVGEGLLIDKGAFHQTRSVSESGAFIMEIESPVNKRDLVRLKDEYGREGKGYEKSDKHSVNLQNYNYLSLHTPEIHYNLKKQFGQCSLTFKKISHSQGIEDLFTLNNKDVISVLCGQILNKNGQTEVGIGDTVTVEELKNLDMPHVDKYAELLITKKIDTLIKTTDYIARFLVECGIKSVFISPGNANVHLLDSIGRCEKLSFFCPEGENSASMAAEAYSKISENIGVLVLSSGSSGTNAISGIARAWVDSTPILVISGQDNIEFKDDLKVRQLGTKSLNIVDIVKPITKYAVRVTDPKTIRYHLEKAVSFAKSGRPGPVWIDLPIDVQGVIIDEKELQSAEPQQPIVKTISPNNITTIIRLLTQAKRPVLLGGNGIRLAGAEKIFLELIDQLGIPTLTSRRGADLLTEDHPLYYGRPGVYGHRKANFVIQNADLLLCIGSRLSIPLIGRNTEAFARAAKKIIVDIDQDELEKSTFNSDISICQSADSFMEELLKGLSGFEQNYNSWIDQCQDLASKFSIVSEEYKHKTKINPYLFIHQFSEHLQEEEIIVYDGGSIMNYVMQTFQLKMGQRLVCSTGLELPGFAVPGAIGVSQWVDKPIYCLCEGEGILNSISNLQAIATNQLPIKILIFRSQGNATVRKIQRDFFGSRYVGTDDEILFSCPEIKEIARVYDIPFLEIKTPDKIVDGLKDFQCQKGPVICEIHVESDQELIPRMGFTIKEDGKWLAKPLEDMYPLLDRNVLKNAMCIDLWEED
jgi:acetolactate synthase I/II/III large subunit